MSQSDSFIDEVTEEVRRDRLFGVMRRYGWLVILAVLALVGAATWREIDRANTRAAAQDFGTQVLSALQQDAPEARLDGLGAIAADGAHQAALLSLITASETANADRPQEAAAALRQLAETPGLLPRYRDLALLKAHLLAPQEPALAQAELAALAADGAPYAVIAQELQAVALVEAGDRAAARSLFEALAARADLSLAQRERVNAMLLALSGAVTGTGQ